MMNDQRTPAIDPHAIERAAEAIGSARRICVLTGAGVSAESGVPTFRGAGGLWKNYRPEEVSNPDAFARSSTGLGVVQHAAERLAGRQAEPRSFRPG